MVPMVSEVNPLGFTLRVFLLTASITTYICPVVRVCPSILWRLCFSTSNRKNFHLSSYHGHVDSQCMREIAEIFGCTTDYSFPLREETSLFVSPNGIASGDVLMTQAVKVISRGVVASSFLTQFSSVQALLAACNRSPCLRKGPLPLRFLAMRQCPFCIYVYV